LVKSNDSVEGNRPVDKNHQSSAWAKENCPYEVDPQVIDLWRVNLSDADLDRSQSILSDDEQQRADKFLLDAIRSTFVRSRCALRIVLARCLDQKAASLEFNYTEQGKPQLASPMDDDFHFNLSHSEDTALIVVANGRRVGIDISSSRRATRWQPIAKRSFSVSELNLLLKLPEVDQEATFHRIWTQKEAYTKAIGDGYSYGFQKFTVEVDADGGSGLLADDNNPHSVGEWNVQSINVGPDYIAALAYDGAQVSRIRQWEFCLE
jgi:4'-phosphopantetheinyl transferase